jgi:photosystem II stability/assembly factor-like uncharacterized protein
MRKLLSLLVLLALWGPSVAQTKSKNKSTVGVYLKTVTHDRVGNVWVGGSVWLLQGLLLRISSTGVKVILPPNVTTVNRLLFTDRRTAWMIADYKNLYRSTDRGNTWQKRLTADSNLEDIAFVGNYGWLVGWNGTIYSTHDHGNSWSLRPGSVDIELTQVAFTDCSRGWAAGPSGLLSTSDGGESWTDITPPKVEPRSVAFVDRVQGLGVDSAHNWRLIRTEDGGATWQTLTNVTQTGFAHVFFANPSHGWAVGETILHTADGGRTWSLQQLPKSGLSYSRISFSGLLNGAAINIGAMHSDTTGDIIRTGNGGRSWRVVPNAWLRPTTDKVYRAKFPSLARPPR